MDLKDIGFGLDLAGSGWTPLAIGLSYKHGN
jgi:hypothetical protein